MRRGLGKASERYLFAKPKNSSSLMSFRFFFRIGSRSGPHPKGIRWSQSGIEWPAFLFPILSRFRACRSAWLNRASAACPDTP